MAYKPQIERGEMNSYLETRPGLNYLKQEARRLLEEEGINPEQMMEVLIAMYTNGDGASIAEKLKKLPKD